MKSYPSSAISYSLSFPFSLSQCLPFLPRLTRHSFISFRISLALVDLVSRHREEIKGKAIRKLNFFLSYSEKRERYGSEKNYHYRKSVFFLHYLKNVPFLPGACWHEEEKIYDNFPSRREQKKKKSFHCLDKKIMHFVRHTICLD